MVQYFANGNTYSYGMCYKCLSIFYKNMAVDAFSHRDECPICDNKELLIERHSPPHCVVDIDLTRFPRTTIKEIPKDSNEYRWLLEHIISENDIQYYLKR